MSRITQLYVFPSLFSFQEQLDAVQQEIAAELRPIFNSADLMVMNAEVETGTISPLQIEQVRDLQLEVLRSPLQHRFRLFVVMNIHTASVPAVNALLKVLEEPPEHVQFVLTTNQLGMVMETVQSRSQVIQLQSSKNREAPQLPEELSGVLAEYPKRTLTLSQVFSLSEKYKERPMAQELVNELIRAVHLKQLSRPSSFWTAFLQQALESLSLLERNVNTRLIIEELLFTFVQTGQSG